MYDIYKFIFFTLTIASSMSAMDTGTVGTVNKIDIEAWRIKPGNLTLLHPDYSSYKHLPFKKRFLNQPSLLTDKSKQQEEKHEDLILKFNRELVEKYLSDRPTKVIKKQIGSKKSVKKKGKSTTVWNNINKTTKFYSTFARVTRSQTNSLPRKKSM